MQNLTIVGIKKYYENLTNWLSWPIIPFYPVKVVLRRGLDRMVVGFTTTYAFSAYHHESCGYEPRSWRGLLNKTLCDKCLSVTCDRSVVFSGYSNTSTNKTGYHDITEILLNVALSTINQTKIVVINTYLDLSNTSNLLCCVDTFIASTKFL
jgi:hypothetical protein